MRDSPLSRRRDRLLWRIQRMPRPGMSSRQQGVGRLGAALLLFLVCQRGAVFGSHQRTQPVGEVGHFGGRQPEQRGRSGG